AALPGWKVSTPEEAESVAAICRRLDGIALAIELAAARVEALSPAEILERLQARFTLLTRGVRTAPPRQKTLRALIDWSYELLGEDERHLLRLLSIFAGGWALEAADTVAIAGGLNTAELTVDLLASLVAKSLVIAEATAGCVRYHMLETIREYAGE